MKKWFLSILLVLVMVIGSLPVNVLAEGGSSLTDDYGEFVSGGQVLSDMIAKNGENAHPRIIMTDERINKLKGSIGKESVTGTLLEKLRSEANRLLSSPVSEYDISDGIRLLETSKRLQRRVAALAMAYNIFGDEKYAERCYKELEAACNFADWNPSHFLDTAEMCTAFALGYDWLYDWMNENQRALLRSNMIEKGLEQGMEDYEDVPRERTYKWYQDYPGDNWKLVCNGGLSLAALAIGDEADAKEIASEVLTYAYKEAYSFVRRAYSEKDGTYTEGLGYWDYATYYLGLFSSALKSTAGKDYGLADHEGLRKSVDFVRYMSSNTSKSFSFGDDGESRDTGWAVLLWLAKNYESYDIAIPRLKKIEGDSFNYLDLLWIDEEKTTGSAVDSPTDWGEVGASNASFRNTWDESGLVAALHTGLNNYKYHGHYDLGSFYVESNGARFFTDLGNEDYELTNRKYSYRIKAEGHNTLVINPSTEFDTNQKEGAECLISSYKEGNEAYAVTDLTAAYEDSGAESVLRGLKMIKDKECVIIQDEISLNAPGEIYWFGHTKGQIEVDASGRSAVITVGSERLWVEIISDAGTFTVMNAELLPTSPAVPGQTDNSEYRKLAIHLTGTQDTTISVACIPLKSGETQPLWIPTVQSIADWDSENVESCTHEHKTLMSDTNSHWYRCGDCGTSMEKNAHSGGTATCKEQAVCTVCEVEYGELAGHADADHDGRCDVCSKVVGTITSWKFDFGNAGVEAGYIGVAAEDAYDADLGYGFASTDAVENVTASGTSALLKDAVQFISGVSGHVFHVDLPSGVYKITVTTGDVQSTTINAEGLPQLFFLTGSNAVDTFTIPVTDGQLNIYAGSGVGGKYSISSLEIERTSTGTTTKPTIWIGGDSTAANYYNVPADAKRGWGQYLSNYVDMDQYDIRNISASGIDAEALKDSLFPTAEYYGKAGDIMILAVGLNDYSQQYTGDPDAVDPTEYIANMTEMIRRAKAKGMTVYLVKQHGQLEDCSKYPVLTSKWFGEELETIAATENVGIIDLFEPWLVFCLENTVRVAGKYYSDDKLHMNALGADMLAGMVKEQLFPAAKPAPGEDPYKNFDTSSTVYYEAEASGEPVVNPHKGYVMTVYDAWAFESTNAYGIGGSMNNTAWEMSTICTGEPKWDELNPEEGVYDWSSIDRMLEACEKYGYTYGIRILPYSHLSGSHDNYGKDHVFVPDWVFEKGAQMDRATLYNDPSVELDIPKWDDPIFLQAAKDFATALAAKYDGDPRVEFIDISVFGNWGEWHTSTFNGNPMPSVEIQKEMIKYYSDAFDKTWLCVTSGAYGEVYDYARSLGIPKRVNGLIGSHNNEWNLRPNYYHNLPVIGENFLPYRMMLDPTVAEEQGIVKDYDKHYLRWTPQRFRETIEISHLSIYAFDQDSHHSYEFYNEQKDLIEEMNNRLGYNYTVTSAKRNGNKLLVTIKNTGLAPSFFDIELSAEITDAEGNRIETFGQPVTIASGTFHDEEEKSFLFEYNGTLDADAEICLAMYDIARCDSGEYEESPIKKTDPTIKFDNKNTLSNNRLLLVDENACETHADANGDGKCDVCGKTAGSVSSYRFDFGGAGVEAGYTGVSANDEYSEAVGYGFANTTAVSDVTASGEGALSDAVQFDPNVPNHVFKVDLPSGVYKITVTTGDVQSTTINAEGYSQLFFLTGSNASDTFTIPVTDGQLNIHAGSGVGGKYSISALEIERTSTGTTTKPTIWIGGDSTVASYYNVPADAKRGWGQYLSNYVDMDKYDIRNLSASGLRSDGLKSSLFGTAEHYGKSGDIILFAVGINDYIDEYKAHPGAMDPSDYIANMTDMIQRAKAKGMTVYLVKQQGELSDCKAYPIPSKKWFSDEIDAMAAAENVGVIDLFSPWLEFCLENTSIEAREYYAPGENLHPNALGADKLAEMVSEQLFSTEEPKEEETEEPYKDFDNATTVYYEMEASEGSIANPHKGFVMTVYNPDMLYEGKHPYGIGGSMNNHAWDVVSIVSDVLFWEDLNPAEGIYKFDKIDTMLEACEEAGMTYGIRIIPYTTSKGSDANFGEEHDFVPQWVYDKGAQQKLVTYKYGDPNVQIKVPDWSDPVYIKAYKDFTKALADEYNGDPRVEYVEIRAFGNMGEWHASEFEGIEMPSLEIQKDMLDYFAEVFDETTCCLMSDAKGEIYDYALSLGITKRNNGLILTPNEEWDLVPAYKANLPTMADNHNTYENMLDKDGTLSGEYLKWTPERFRETIEIAHLSIYALDQEGYGSYLFYQEQKELIDEMSKRLGYNFTVTSAKRNENQLLVTIKNTGVAPAFFDIDLCAEITDAEGNKVGTFGSPVKIAKGTFRDDTEQTFLFEHDGTLEEDAIISLAMYESDKLVTTYAMRNARAVAQNPTVKFDNKNAMSTNRLMMVVDESMHTHAGTKVEQQDATCTEFGVKAYYKCPCGKFYEDAACTSEIVDLEAWKSGAGRIALKDHVGGTATDKERAKCSVCGNEYGELASSGSKPNTAPTDTPTNTPSDTPTDIPANTPGDTPTDTPANKPGDTPTDIPANTPGDTPTGTSTVTTIEIPKASVEEQAVSNNSKGPLTGDDTNPWLFAGFGFAAMLAGICIIAWKQKKEEY